MDGSIFEFPVFQPVCGRVIKGTLLRLKGNIFEGKEPNRNGSSVTKLYACSILRGANIVATINDYNYPNTASQSET